MAAVLRIAALSLTLTPTIVFADHDGPFARAYIHGKDASVSGEVTFMQIAPLTVRVSASVSGLPDGTFGFHIHQHGDLRSPMSLEYVGVHFVPVCRSSWWSGGHVTHFGSANGDVEDADSTAPDANDPHPWRRQLHSRDDDMMMEADDNAIEGVSMCAHDQLHGYPPSAWRMPGDMGNITIVGGEGVFDVTLGQDKVSLTDTWRSIVGRSIVVHDQNDKGPDFQPFGDTGNAQAAGVIFIDLEDGETRRLTSGDCADTCYSQTCDYWVDYGAYTCSAMENQYGCDCDGCVCGGSGAAETVASATASVAPGDWARAVDGDDEADALMCRLVPAGTRASALALDDVATAADAGDGTISGEVFLHKTVSPGSADAVIAASIAGLTPGETYNFAIHNFSASGPLYSPTGADAIWSEAVAAAEWCAAGIVDSTDTACCADEECDGQCGGSGCSSRAGGASLCCSGTIRSAGTECASASDVGCVIPDHQAGAPLFIATGADDGYTRTLFDSREAWHGAGGAPNVTSLARYAGRIGVLSTGSEVISGEVVAECAIGFAARMAPAIDTAAYAVTAHVYDTAGGAHVGSVTLSALGVGGADCDVLLTVELDGLADGTYLLRVREYGDVAVKSSGALDDDALGDTLSDALGRVTVSGGVATRSQTLAASDAPPMPSGDGGALAALARGLTLHASSGGDVTSAPSAVGVFELAAPRDGAWFNGAAGADDAKVATRLVAPVSSSYSPLATSADVHGSILFVGDGDGVTTVYGFLNGLEPDTTYEITMHNGTTSPPDVTGDAFGEPWLPLYFTTDDLDNDDGEGAAAFLITLGAGEDAPVALAALAGKTAAVYAAASGALVAAAPLGALGADRADELADAVNERNRDCVLSDWSEWGDCSTDCGVGVQWATREALTEATGDGAKCKTFQLEASRGCSQFAGCPYSDDGDNLAGWEAGLISAFCLLGGCGIFLCLQRVFRKPNDGEHLVDREGQPSGLAMT